MPLKRNKHIDNVVVRASSSHRWIKMDIVDLMSLTRIAQALGATEPTGTYLIAIFIPSADRDGASIDQDYWINEALEVLGRLFGGATAMPRGSGLWRDDLQGGVLKSDESVVVFCVAKFSDVPPALVNIRRFLHRMGREAVQGEVGVIMGVQYFGIRKYDASET